MSEAACKSTVEEIGKQARETVNTAAAAAGAFGQRATETGAAVRHAVLEQVEHQPMATLVMAAGAGLLAGLLLARR